MALVIIETPAVIAMVCSCIQMIKGSSLRLVVLVFPNIDHQKEGKEFLMKV